MTATTYKRAKRVEITGDGLVSAQVCTFDVIDHDGDVVTRRALTNGAPVAISTWNHGSWQPGQPPIGTGVLRVTGTEAIVDAQLFMNTQAGAETFEVLRELQKVGIGEWSWSLEQIVSRPAQMNGRSVRFIDKVAVRECSPVMRGASIGSRTLSAKDLQVIEQGRRHVEAVEARARIERAELERIRDQVDAMAEASLRHELARSRDLLNRLAATW